MPTGSTTVTEEAQAAFKATEKAGENEIDTLVADDVDSTDSTLRYAAYTNRLRTALRAGTRYIAYTSDVGESFRPIVPPWVVTAGYAISWAYLGGDVSFETYKAYKHGPTPLEAANFAEPTRLGMFAVKRAVFQGVASMALPAFTIHSVVRYSAGLYKNVKNPRVRGWAPTLTGLAVVPLLPYLFDHPVEWATDVAFEKIEESVREYNRKNGVPQPVVSEEKKTV